MRIPEEVKTSIQIVTVFFGVPILIILTSALVLKGC